MKILIFTYWDNKSKDKYSFKEIGELTNPSKQEYCKIHNYDFKFYSLQEYNKEIGWFKIDIFKNELPNYDWIFYCEADCLITNFTKRIEDIIDNNYDIIIAKNTVSKGWDGLNCGNLIIKNSEWSKEFLNNWNKDETYYHHNQAEQGSLINKFNSFQNVNDLGDFENHFKIVSPRIFGGFRHQWYPNDNWQPGDWIMHLAGCHNWYRYNVFNYLKDKIIKAPDYKLPFEPFV